VRFIIGKQKIYISIIVSIVFIIAVLWLIIRACSGIPVVGALTYKIGRDSTWYPLDLRGKEQAMVGFSNDLIKAIAAEQGFKAVVFEVGPYALFDGLDIGNYEAVLSSLTPNPINLKRYGFSDPFYLVGPVLVVNEDSNISSLKGMTGKIMGIESGALQVFNIPEPPDIVIIPYDTAAVALENLDQKVIDGVLVDALRAYVWTDGFYAGRLKVVTAPLTYIGFSLVTRH
jgi:polar amino acid transport system substrate-binding protein